MESARTFVPTLGLVRSDGSVKTSNKSDDQESDSKTSSVGNSDSSKATGSARAIERFEDSVSPPQMNSAMEFTSSEIEEVIKRPRLTLLILKEPSASKDEGDYVVANAPPDSDFDIFDDESISHKKSKFLTFYYFQSKLKPCSRNRYVDRCVILSI